MSGDGDSAEVVVPEQLAAAEGTEESTAPAVVGDEGGGVAAVRRLVAPLSKEQLIELLASAAVKHADVLESCQSIVRESPASRRLMIRNIAFSTKDEDFIGLFSGFGALDDAAIVRDRDEKSKGYGFVTFRSAESVSGCFAAKELVLDGRRLLAKLAGDPYADFSVGGTVNNKQTPGVNNEGSRRKLFVRNLGPHTTSESLKVMFSEHGALEECVVVSDAGGRSKGYGFVTFLKSEDAIKAVQQPQRVIDGKVAFVAFATPTRNRSQQYQAGTYGARYGASTAAALYDTSLAGFNAPGAALTAAGGGLYAYNPPSYPVMSYYGGPRPGEPSAMGGRGHLHSNYAASTAMGMPVAGDYDYMTGAASRLY